MPTAPITVLFETIGTTTLVTRISFPSIRRVITIGTPHRGSEFANDYTRWLGRKLITLPDWMEDTVAEVPRRNPGFFRDTDLLTVNTSIDSLAPDSPMLPVLLRARKSPRTRYHNIVGLVGDAGIVGRLAAGSDGVVNFESAHLEDVASEIDMHESTVSRVTNGKYVQTPRGVFELKFFFSSGLGTAGGEDISSKAAKEKISRLVGEEDKAKPLSDQKLADVLKAEGIDIARRTVAKYREQLGIASARMRKRH